MKIPREKGVTLWSSLEFRIKKSILIGKVMGIWVSKENVIFRKDEWALRRIDVWCISLQWFLWVWLSTSSFLSLDNPQSSLADQIPRKGIYDN